MNKSQINIDVELDDQKIPEKIQWSASDHNEGKAEPSEAFSLSIWDPGQKNTLRIDLWTKEMQVHEMKQFCIDSIGGFAQTILNATGDEYISTELREVCNRLAAHLEKEIKEGKYR